MRLILLFLSIFINLHAGRIEAYYRISYGIVGEVGVAKASLTVFKDKTYSVNIEANTTGIAKFLSGNRHEIFTSKGRVLEDGRLVPNTYRHEVIRLKKKNSFTLNPKKWKEAKSKKLTIVTFHEDKIIQKKRKIFDGDVYYKSDKTLDYFVQDDLLSLFFNFKIQSNNFNITKKTPFYAVGASDKDGRLDIFPMPKKLLDEFFDTQKGHNFIVTINKPVFSSKNGELLIQLDDDGICTSAVLRDVLFFGDIKGILVKKNVF